MRLTSSITVASGGGAVGLAGPPAEGSLESPFGGVPSALVAGPGGVEPGEDFAAVATTFCSETHSAPVEIKALKVKTPYNHASVLNNFE